jgi:hypothetical protein
MSNNSVILTIATIIFVILLTFVAYFIYQGQKLKFNIIPSTCPDYWSFDGQECTPQSKTDGPNIGTCGKDSSPATSIPISKYKTVCEKYAYITNKNLCGGTTLWDGITNNPDLRTRCLIKR